MSEGVPDVCHPVIDDWPATKPKLKRAERNTVIPQGEVWSADSDLASFPGRQFNVSQGPGRLCQLYCCRIPLKKSSKLNRYFGR